MNTKHKNIIAYQANAISKRSIFYFTPKRLVSFTYIILLFFLNSCTKQVAVSPPDTSINEENIYNTDATAIGVLTGIYAKMSQTSDYVNRGVTTLSIFAGLSADELSLYSGTTDLTYIAYYRNALSVSTLGNADFWSNIYPYVYTANSAIQGISNATGLTPAVKQQLLGEAKFLRAFFYFYLVNLYGDVALPLTTDYNINASLPRSPQSEVYDQIITDLKEAQKLLTDGYVTSDGFTTYATGSEVRVRPNSACATALLARVYLYIRDWSNAEQQASTVIQNSTLYNLTGLNDVFLNNSSEAIWQLQPVNSGWNTEDAKKFIIPARGPSDPNNPVYLSSFMINSFEAGDKRRGLWVDSVIVGSSTYYYPYKYKVKTQNAPVTEYLMVLRLGEQYLIRAEARAQQNNLQGANSDLNSIHTRAGLANVNINDKNTILSAILHERQVELFTEWGHRWLDLKRTGNINAVMNTVSAQKGGSWNSNWAFYPIPLLDIQRNPGLIQNQGY